MINATVMINALAVIPTEVVVTLIVFIQAALLWFLNHFSNRKVNRAAATVQEKALEYEQRDKFIAALIARVDSQDEALEAERKARLQAQDECREEVSTCRREIRDLKRQHQQEIKSLRAQLSRPRSSSATARRGKK